ncbi:Uncharacterized protein TCAP_02326 [Tolypocladium capitatum]|uniref:tRNA A64-2'-O-ribosylphosphate transferase n=1 Tax=Tolypocladium capitatum TaxID=45235 RepID=A0A2K3QJM3_9HYPO|nr:Uncharacterized protein TCAP_02326 [Tolypocladium capitatum]
MAPPASDKHPLHTDLVFPPQPSLSALLAGLRRSALSIHNRLASIHADAQFVARAAAALAPGAPDAAAAAAAAQGDSGEAQTQAAQTGARKRRLVANERCGSWYVPPARKAASAYFKSTDGHERAWKFSTRRLNLHLVDMIERDDGLRVREMREVSADEALAASSSSTRPAAENASMPDALSTTIPVWCAVLNQVLLPSHPLSPTLFLPPHLLPSTHAQIAALIPSFVAALRALDLALPTALTKPLRPLWITPDSLLERDDGVLFDEYRPVVCCTASRRVVGSEVDERGYVQGAGDDTENWACGLTPAVFWAHVDELLAAPEADLPDLISQLVLQHEFAKRDTPTSPYKRLTPQISVCHLPLNLPTTPTACHIALGAASTPKDTWRKSPTYLEAGLGRNKTASRNLRLALPEICAFAAGFLEKGPSSGDGPRQLVVACDSGKDVSVGAALALSCYLFDDGGRFRMPGEDVSFTKTLVRVRLGGIMTAYPEANPSRQTLQSVNSFLMDWRN